MRFRGAHKLTSYLMVVSALVTLMATPVATLAMYGVVFALLALSWRSEPEYRTGRFVERFDNVLKLGAIGTLIYAAYLIYRSFPEPDLSPLLDFILYMIVYKLFSRRSNRDYLQLYILSFLIVLGSAWLAQSALFAFGFVMFVVTSIWALILFHLRREIEDNYLIKHNQPSAAQRVTIARVLDSRRVVGRSFFSVTALAAVAVLIGSAIVFTVAPRIGIGFLTGGLRRGNNVVGFSDEVKLGRHGVISDENQVVALRARIARIEEMSDEAARESIVSSLYFRGTVYDVYREGQWVRSYRKQLKTQLSRGAMGRSSLVFTRGPEHEPESHPRLAEMKNTIRQEIQLVGIRQPVAFALDQPVAYEFAPPAVGSFVSIDLEARWSGETALRMMRLLRLGVYAPVPNFAGASYVAYSRDTLSDTPLLLPISRAELPDSLFETYLAVPPSLTPRVRALAITITRKAKTDEEKARAVYAWLRKNKKYTVDLKRDESVPDPLEDFLFVQSAGHCEYFASAAAILLRLVDVPTRYVNGFLGGEWNPLTGHITVRDNRAHSWVEVYDDGKGWTRLDATPPVGRTSNMNRVRQLIDSVELWWGAWVLEYDASRQVQLARRARGTVDFRSGSSRSWKTPSGKQVLMFLLVLAVVATAWRLWRRKGGGATLLRAAEEPRTAARKPYRRALIALARIGIRREPAQTPSELLALACVRVPSLAGPLEKITRLYEYARYAEREPDGPTLEEMMRLVREVEGIVDAERKREQAARAA
jgi:protein-glutamine gamma-glutamyltransferase